MSSALSPSLTCIFQPSLYNRYFRRASSYRQTYSSAASLVAVALGTTHRTMHRSSPLRPSWTPLTQHRTSLQRTLLAMASMAVTFGLVLELRYEAWGHGRGTAQGPAADLQC